MITKKIEPITSLNLPVSRAISRSVPLQKRRRTREGLKILSKKRVFLCWSREFAVILTRAHTCPRHLDESTLPPSRIMGCDDASITALRSLSGMTNATSTFPAARFRPAPVLMLRHVRDNPRPAVVSAGAASPLATPRSTCVPRSSHRSRDRAAHRDAASEVVPRATRETRTSPMPLLRDFRDLSRRRRM